MTDWINKEKKEEYFNFQKAGKECIITKITRSVVGIKSVNRVGIPAFNAVTGQEGLIVVKENSELHKLYKEMEASQIILE